MEDISRVRREMRRLDALCGVDTNNILITVSHRAFNQMGCCKYLEGKPYEINISDFMFEEREELFLDVVRHEYAHALVKIRFPGENHGHDSVWKRACIEVGANPSRENEEGEAQKKKCAEKASATKYVVVCNQCGLKYNYKRRSTAIKMLLAGSKGCSCGRCHSKDLTVEKL